MTARGFARVPIIVQDRHVVRRVVVFLQRTAATWRYTVGFVGLVALGVATWKTAVGSGGGGSVVALITAAALLLVSPLVIDRVSDLTIGTDGLTLRLVSEIAQTAPQTAQILGHTELAVLAESYAVVRQELRGDDHRRSRKAVQDLIIKRAAALAQRQKFNSREVRELFANGAPVIRVLALGLMEGDPTLADAGSISSAIENPGSRNEQYHGLKLAQLCWRRLTASDRTTILAIINDVDFPPGSDREAAARGLRSPVAS